MYASETTKVEARRRAHTGAPDVATARAGSIDPVSLLQLQRSAGNVAVSAMLARLLIQRKPADINASHTVTFSNKGPIGVAKAPRVKGLKPSLLINAQIKDGWVLPNGVKLKGGHLLKAQYGGPDDATNVVSWSTACEEDFGRYEDTFAAAAKEQSRKDKQSVTIKLDKAATFADRPGLQLTDQELDKAGWGPTAPGRKERQKKYAEIAENFSTIPTKATVAVSGLKTNPPQFERDGLRSHRTSSRTTPPSSPASPPTSGSR